MKAVMVMVGASTAMIVLALLFAPDSPARGWVVMCGLMCVGICFMLRIFRG